MNHVTYDVPKSHSKKSFAPIINCWNGINMVSAREFLAKTSGKLPELIEFLHADRNV